MEPYPASLRIDYAEESDRVSVLFRIFLAIPILILMALLTGVSYEGPFSPPHGPDWYGAGVVVLPTVLMILIREKYPRWWFDWNLELTRFSLRIASYVLLLRDEYPSTDEEQAVHVRIDYPDVQGDLTRWMPLVKWILAIPHYFILFFLGVAAFFATVFAWFAILFTGTYPRTLFDFVEGTLRWGLRVEAYAVLLVTDEYPPFRLAALPGEGGEGPGTTGGGPAPDQPEGPADRPSGPEEQRSEPTDGPVGPSDRPTGPGDRPER